MTAVVLSGAPSAPEFPTIAAAKVGAIESFIKGVVFYGLLVGGMVIPFAGSTIQVFIIN